MYIYWACEALGSGDSSSLQTKTSPERKTVSVRGLWSTVNMETGCGSSSDHYVMLHRWGMNTYCSKHLGCGLVFLSFRKIHQANETRVHTPSATGIFFLIGKDITVMLHHPPHPFSDLEGGNKDVKESILPAPVEGDSSNLGDLNKSSCSLHFSFLLQEFLRLPCRTEVALRFS